MPLIKKTQQERALKLLSHHGMLRAREFAEAGIAAMTLARMKKKGLVSQFRRGLYVLPDATPGSQHDLATVAKTLPRGVICLVSALAFHELTTTLPGRVWVAIGSKDRRPAIAHPPLVIVRFSPRHLATGHERHRIDGVDVRITNPVRTIVDLFRYRKTTGLNIAIEGLREALRQRKATPAEIAKVARQAGLWSVVQPYLEAMTSRV